MKKMTQIGKTWEDNKFLFSFYFGMNGARDFIMEHPVEAGITIEDYAECNSYWFTVVKDTVLTKFPEKYVIQVVGAIINERIKWFRYRQDSLIKKNDDMRDKGIPYTVRRDKIIGRLASFEKIISEYEELSRGYKVVPLGQILTPDLVRDIKRWGFKKFLNFYFEYICLKN